MAEANAVLVPILNDADISCTGTTEVVVYGKAIPFIHRAKSVQPFLDIYFIQALGGGTATVRVFGQWTVDGVNWSDFAGNLASETAAGMYAEAENTVTRSFGPAVRFNVGIVNSAAAAASARLSVVINVRFF